MNLGNHFLWSKVPPLTAVSASFRNDSTSQQMLIASQTLWFSSSESTSTWMIRAFLAKKSFVRPRLAFVQPEPRTSSKSEFATAKLA
jgi:hypothetical protein